ncbi:putative MFS family arabinose efflux permease [Williamsia muralis]|uniref:Putative MFS family arabinose efflux permease n=1 Tax=Williamsia marianensis TaxID=85044 RepID=A0A495JXS7_WILMA|nr:MFS transporter [Williamsia muralis]RKR93833.1 putative MFS family arabinose efflux permease [Williamsia muralis]
MRNWRGVSAAMFAIAWGGNEFTPLLVFYKSEYELSGPTVDVLLFAYVLGMIPALLIGGPLSDRFGRRPIMRPAALIAAAGSLVLAAAADQGAILAVGRILCGIAIGLAMAVGTSWIKELSVDNGAKRAAMSLTAGFGVGAGLAGVLAEWGPWPHVLSYVLNAGVCLLGAVWVWSVPETRQRATAPTRLRDDLKIPSLGHRRFLYVVVPVAPWVFGAAIGCQAILPTLMAPKVGGAPMAFAALISVVTLSCGFGIQALARRIDRPDSARASQVALLLLVAGMALAALASSILTIWAVLVAAVVLGAGYGIALVAGLSEVQRIAQPGDLAGLTAVYYALTYLGFAVPATLAYLHDYIPGVTYPWMFGFGAVAAAATLAMISRRSRRDLPSASPAPAPLASAQL